MNDISSTATQNS